MVKREAAEAVRLRDRRLRDFHRAQEERRKRERRKHREELGKPVSRWFWFEKYAPGSLNW